MPEKYGDLKLEVPTGTDEAGGADVPASFRRYTDSLADAFTGPSGQLLIAQPSDVAKFLAMKGDATLAADGTITIGKEKVTNDKIGKKAVGGENLNDLSVGPSHLGEKAVGPSKIADALRPSAGAAAGTEALRALGTSASTAAAGNDARLSDERTPKANSVNEGKIADGAVSDAKLASPNNPAYRTLMQAGSSFSNDYAANTHLLGEGGDATTANIVGGGGIRFSIPSIIYLDDADYAVAGKATKLRVRAQIFVNEVKAALKFTFGLYPLTASSGGSDTLSLTKGAVIGGSTVEINEPAANARTSAVGADFDIPADGSYALAVVTSAALTNNSAVFCAAQLQLHHV